MQPHGLDSSDIKKLSISIDKLRLHIEANRYEGFDPYDALKSPIISKGPLRSIHLAGFLFQQFIKRLPFNLRPVLGIRKGLNPVTLGLCIQAYTALGRSGSMNREDVIEKCNHLIGMLEKLIPNGYHGACWGYDFPWQSKYFTVDAYQPSIVATGIIANGLFHYHKFSGSEKAKDLIKSSSGFVLNDLNRIEGGDGTFCFSYTPFDKYPVYNASMKAVRLLAQVYALNGDEQCKTIAGNALRYVMNAQNPDGSWYYTPGSKGQWIDSYHTGYVLDCASEYAELTGDNRWDQLIKKGYDFFIDHFINKDLTPAFFHDRPLPLDCTAAAQVILTLCRFGDPEKAMKSCLVVIDAMQSDKGYFYFRKFKYLTRKESFMRWSDAWMFAAMAELSSEAPGIRAVNNPK